MGDSGALALGLRARDDGGRRACSRPPRRSRSSAPLLVMAVPILDTSFVVLKRLKYRRAAVGSGPQPLLPPLHAHRLLAAEDGGLPAPVGGAAGRLTRSSPASCRRGPAATGTSATRCSSRASACVVVAASVWMVYTLEILKTRHLHAARLQALRARGRRSRGSGRARAQPGRCRRARARPGGVTQRAIEPRPGSASSSSSAGVAPDALCERARGLALERELVRVLESSCSRPSRDELLVDPAELALEDRPHRRAEHGRLAVHRAAGRDEHVGERDEAAAVDGPRSGTITRSSPSARDARALLGRCGRARPSARARRCEPRAARARSSGFSEPPR